MNTRDAVLDSFDMWSAGYAYIPKSPVRRAADLGALIRFFWNGRFTRRPKPVNVDELATKWVDAIAGMSTAHDKDEYDKHDAKSDELLTPILSMPIKQVREFYGLVRTKLKEDKRIPMIVWMGFEAWGETTVENSKDDRKIRRLKNKLAKEIAELVELPIQDQIPEAVKRALRWRDPETLKKVKERLESGEKPRLKGRQSCLFLEVGKPGSKDEVKVML